MNELILGGQRSGKSRCAEERAIAWLRTPGRQALLVATARAGDAEMRARIDRHRADRAERVPGMATVEEPLELAAAIERFSAPERLIVVDCLTLWLTNLRLPVDGAGLSDVAAAALCTAPAAAVRSARGPVVLVSNEIGLGVSPLSREARHFVDELGRLHQALAAICGQVTLMVAGIEVAVKREPA